MNFSFELLHEIHDKWNDEIDVVVLLKDESKYHVTFVTHKFVVERFKTESYSIFTNTIFLEELTLENIENSLKDIILSEIYSSLFYPINEISQNKLIEKFKLENEANLDDK